jgi:hypothetical protein
MKKSIFFIFCFAASLLGVLGCYINIQIVPPQEQVEELRLPQIALQHSVAVVAVKTLDSTSVEFCTGRGRRYMGKLDDMTDAAVKNLKEIFKRKNIALAEQADKKLSITVIGASCTRAAYSMSFHADIRVQAGDNISREFAGANFGSFLNEDANFSQAINEALLQMFKSEAIMNYLKH